jgi:hypothetical protein
VQNSVEPYFIGFGPDGEILRTLGSHGGGPDEFQAPSGFVIGGIDGDAWVFDRARHALIEVSRPSAERAVIALPQEAIPICSVAGRMNLLSNQVRSARAQFPTSNRIHVRIGYEPVFDSVRYLFGQERRDASN